jgi:hypothetical protein
MTAFDRSTKPFRIILRYSLDPQNGLEENLKQLERFIQESTINEVMFLIQPEERSSGHPVKELVEPWIDAIRRAQRMFERYGVATSVNPWTTTYHCGRGRKLHDGQSFRLMVGETGAENGMTACPLCVNWQDYICDFFAHLAKEIDPVALWIEDDWRLHNHGGEMGYGGCFCSHCIDRFSKMVGQQVTRQQIVDRVAEGGAPHPWRQLWFDLARSALNEPAKKLSAALKASRPAMRIGLMSSVPDVQSIENRDWNELMDIWTGEGERYLIRPHMPPYTEEPAITTPPSYPRQTIAMLDRDADIFPELENSPRCGQYSGSHAFSIWQIFNSISYGSRGITINHFDNMGMNTNYDRGFGKALGKKRAFFDALMAVKVDDRNARGVKILVSPDVALHRHTDGADSVTGAKLYTGEDLSGAQADDASLQALESNSVGWSRVFYTLGVSHGFTREIEANDDSAIAVSDQTLRCFTDSQIKGLLSRRVILDLASIEILVERGFGRLIGVESVDRARLSDTAYSIEELLPAFFGELEGGVKARMCAQRCADPIGVLRYAPGVEVLSTIKNADLDDLFPASGFYVNELGGKIASICYPLGTAQFYMGYFNVVRQRFWSKLLFKLCDGPATPVIASGHVLQIHAHEVPDGLFCAVSNVIYDVAEQFSLSLSKESVVGKTVHFLNADAEWEVISPEIIVEGEHATIYLNIRLLPLESAFLKIGE